LCGAVLEQNRTPAHFIDLRADEIATLEIDLAWTEALYRAASGKVRCVRLVRDLFSSQVRVSKRARNKLTRNLEVTCEQEHSERASVEDASP